VAAPEAPPKAAPVPKAPKDVSAVALKDAPLRSLYPDEPAPPLPVRARVAVPLLLLILLLQYTWHLCGTQQAVCVCGCCVLHF